MLKKNGVPLGDQEFPFTGERYTPEIGGSIELEHLHRYLLAKQLVEGKYVLDIACGEGYGSALLARAAQYVFGVDIAPEAIEHARKRYTADNLEFRNGSCTEIPLQDASVDVVVSFETIEHHAEHEAMLHEVRRVLRPDGLLIISSPDKMECTDKTGLVNPHHVKELYRDEFSELLGRHFKNLRMYGQRVLYTSAILSEEGSSPLRNYNIAGELEKGVNGVPHPMFHIAAASDGELPGIEAGFLEQAIEDIEEIKLQKLIITERERLLHVARAELAKHAQHEKQLQLELAARADQAEKFAMLKARPLRSLTYFALRKIYRRFGILQEMRCALRGLRDRLIAGSFAGHNSRDNEKFLNHLMLRRTDATALRTAESVPEPAVWPEIDVSIVTYNSARWLDGFFTSLMAQRYPLDKLHLHIVDNGSRDDTADRVNAFLARQGAAFAGTSFIRQRNMGFGAGHNRALRDGDCAYCLVTNVDLEFLPDSLCNVVRMALSDTEGTVGSWELRQYPYEHPKYYDPVTLETSWSAHACVLIRRAAYNKVRGYDPKIFMYAEDVELSYRLRSYGYVLKYVPSAAVMHYAYEDVTTAKPMQYVGSSIGNLYIRMRYGNWENIVAGVLLFSLALLQSSSFKGVKRRMLRSMLGLLFSLPLIRVKKGPKQAFYPLRGLDYEMRREGAFVEGRALSFPEGQRSKVSVLIRTYKGRGFLLEQAIRTVYNQTYPAIEVIVSEDGGETQRQLVERLAGKAPDGVEVRYLANPKQGRSATGNAALAAATAPYFLFLDDDDLLYADHVETLLQALCEHPECVVAYAPATEVVTDMHLDDERYEEKCFREMAVLFQPWDYNVLLHHNFMVISSLAKRELYLTRGGLDTELEMLEDWNFWLRYGYRNAFAYVPKTTMLFRTPACAKISSLRACALHDAYDTAKSRAIHAWLES